MFSLSRNSVVVWFDFVIPSLLFREFAKLSDVYRTETCRFLFSGHGRRERVRCPTRISLFFFLAKESHRIGNQTRLSDMFLIDHRRKLLQVSSTSVLCEPHSTNKPA